VYIEPDKDEVFNCIAWSYEMNKVAGVSAPIMAAGGVKGVVRVIQCNREKPVGGFKNLIGHTGAINDMKFHPIHPHLIASGSKDYSIRLWNIRNSTCIAIFSGIRGHRDEVLSVDISADGKSLISGGIDHNIMIWSLESEELRDKIDACNGVEGFGKGSRPFKSIRVHFPEFSTRDVHGNYVDTVKYFGSTFLSKSCENNIIWWRTKETSKGPQIAKLFTFDIVDSEIWFMRMELDFQLTQLAVGSQNGKVFVFDLDTEKPVNKRSAVGHPKCTAPVRQMAFSRDGNIMVSACDDGTVWRWDRKE
jgi:polycomb protein EED